MSEPGPAPTALTTGDDPRPQPVFVIALPKTFTSVVGAMLGQHPRLVGLPELNLFIGESVRDWGEQRGGRMMMAGLLRTIAEFEFGEQNARTVQTALRWLEARAEWPVARLFDHLRERAAPAALLDQSPSNSRNPETLERILTLYPDARFIHLTRNPESWCRSIERNGQVGRFIMADRAACRDLPPDTDYRTIWEVTNRQIEARLEAIAPDRKLQIPGEAVIATPETGLSRVLNWLGLSVDASTLERMRRPEESAFAGWGPIGAASGNNPDFLSKPQLRQFDDPDSLMVIDAPGKLPESVITMARAYGYR